MRVFLQLAPACKCAVDSYTGPLGLGDTEVGHIVGDVGNEALSERRERLCRESRRPTEHLTQGLTKSAAGAEPEAGDQRMAELEGGGDEQVES